MRIALIIFCSVFWMGNHPNEMWIIQHKEIIVKGKTSIGSFECSYNNVVAGDTLFFNNRKVDFKPLEFKIPVKEFGCGNFLVNNDFRKTLKAEQHPVCNVLVKRIFFGNNRFFGDIQVNIAGKKLELDKVILDKHEEMLKGNLRLSFNELDLQAPNRLGGLIKIDEELDLEIRLYLD